MKKGKYRTKLGSIFDERSVNQSDVSKRTKIGKNRLTDLCTKELVRIKADELYLISLAIKMDPCHLLEELCSDNKLVKDKT
ncbi:helix-turn-helix domain-containing protein [Belliella marina]|uniref:Helix-turn-helix domain-containing protein n=1 Tax=Belliella marina TaxID=1644146 RepID=A0ABW4VL58_9BACT